MPVLYGSLAVLGWFVTALIWIFTRPTPPYRAIGLGAIMAQTWYHPVFLVPAAALFIGVYLISR